MSQILDITDTRILKSIINDIESEQNRQRRQADYESYEIMEGNQRHYVKKALEELFPESHKVMTPSNINLLKKVNDRVAVAYKDSPRRTINGEQSDTLNEIYSDGEFDRAFSLMDKTYNRSRCVLNWVQNVPGMLKKFKLLSLPQYVFDLVIDNDTLEVLCVILSYPDNSITAAGGSNRSDSMNQIIAESDSDSSATTKQYALWTKDHHVNIRGHVSNTTVIDFMVDDENPEMINRLGMIPFVFTTTQPDLPEIPIENPLSKESVLINVMNSTLLTAATKQIGIMVLKYPQGSSIKEVHSGFTVALQLPQSLDNDPKIETSVEYVVPNSDLAGMKETFLDYTAGILSDNGLEGASLTGETRTYASGLERLIASASTMDRRSENIATYETTEKKVFGIIKRYDEVNMTKMFKRDDEINVIFDEPKVIVSEKERLELVKIKDDLGVLEDVDKFQAAHPGLGDTDIINKMERIASKKKEMLKALDDFNALDDDEVVENDNSKELPEQSN